MNLRKFMMFALLLMASVGFMSMGMSINDWTVPAEYKTKANPKAGKGDPNGVGKKLYALHCKSCHGDKGNGDGKKASTLKHELTDFAEAKFQGQTDGVLYYKSIIGDEKMEMPNFEKKIKSEDERWFVINYLRTLK